MLASQGFPPVSRRSRSRNATQRNGASHAFDASRSGAEVECRRGQRGSLAPWGAEQGWRVLRCFARLSGRRLKRQESKSRHACRPGSGPNTHSAGCERRSATERQRSGGPPVAPWQSRRILTSWPGGRWFPGRPVAEHLAWRGPPGARRQALESGCASIRTERLPTVWPRPGPWLKRAYPASFRFGYQNAIDTKPMTSNPPATAYSRPQSRRGVTPMDHTY